MDILKQSTIPNIMFHGDGSHDIVPELLCIIYKGDKQAIKNNTMYVNCLHGKGIQFIRDTLIVFCKLHTLADPFKVIVLDYADKLTNDAQHALRRCIELYSHSTRFMLIVNTKMGIIKPLLSRFCDVYIPSSSSTAGNSVQITSYIPSVMDKTISPGSIANQLYMNGLSAHDIIKGVPNLNCEIQLFYYNYKSYFRNEELLLLTIIQLIRKNSDLNKLLLI